MSHGSHDMSHGSHEDFANTHGFLMLGTKNLYLCHLPMYGMAPHLFQTILEAEIETPLMQKYLGLKKEDASRPIIVLNDTEMTLEELANSESFFGNMWFSNVNGDPIGKLLGQTTVKVKKLLLFNQLNINSPNYPEHLEYYLFGTNSDWHLSHLLTKAPNFEQELDISISGIQPDNKDSEIFKISILSEDEKSKQHIKKDPLTKRDYEIVTKDEQKFQISITNRFWINNIMLNKGLIM